MSGEIGEVNESSEQVREKAIVRKKVADRVNN